MKILFVCRGNIFRSQMAAALFGKICKDCEIRSAGTVVKRERERLSEKKDNEASLVVEAMQEEGIDLRNSDVKPLTPKLVDWADKVICMAQRDSIPEYLLQSGKMEYWAIEDSVPGSDYDFFVESKERIKKKVEKLAKEVC